MYNPFRRSRGDEKIWRYGDDTERDDSGAPDTERPHGTCPRCGREANFTVAGHFVYTPDFRYVRTEKNGAELHDAMERVALLVCQGCRQTVVVIEEKCLLSHQPRTGGPIIYRGTMHWPPQMADLAEDIPGEIAGVFREAVVAVSANLPRAATILARATLDAVTLDQGEDKKDNLKKRLDNLAARHVLQSALADWATEVRLIGNEGAHDPHVTIEMSDARELVSFVRELLRFLYEMPAGLARRRSATPGA